jgi:ABC-type transport system substrate-binding protein
MIASVRATRAIAILIVAAFIASAVPGAVFDKPVADNAAAVRYEVKLGMLQDVENWNPLNPELVSDYVMVYLMYSVLFQYTEDWTGPVKDLATDYYQVNNPNGTMSTYINITHNAYFRDKAAPNDMSYQLTAEDVRYSIQVVLDHPGGAWDEYLANVTAVEALDSDSVHILTDFPKSTLIDNLVWIPILPSLVWEQYRDNEILSAKTPAELIGSGPFLFNNTQDGYWYRFDRAPNYHGATDYPVGTADPQGDRVVKVDGLLYTVYTEPSAMVLDMNSGSLDAIDLAGSPNLYLNELGQGNPDITKFATQEMGIIDIAINAIPLEFRSGAYGTGNELLLDPIVREAIGMTLNKQEVADTIMFGLAGTADSVLSPGYWHKDITNELTYDPAAARTLLLGNGYADNNADGVLEATASAYPVTQGWASAGDPLSFRLTAPDTDPVYDSIEIGRAHV